MLMRVQLCLWLAATASSLQLPYRNKTKFLMSGFVRSPAYNQLKSYKGGRQSFSRTMLECQRKGKIWVRANFAFLLKERTKNQKLLRGGKLY